MRDYTIAVGSICILVYPMPGIDSNMYIIIENKTALVIDPNKNNEAIKLLKEEQVEKVIILLTHEHFDHISGVNLFREKFYCIVICQKEAGRALSNPGKNMAKFWEITLMNKSFDKFAEGMTVRDDNYACVADEFFDKEKIWKWNGHNIKAIAAPGHAKGGAMYYFDDLLFTGDNLVNGAGVICRIPGGNWKTYCECTLPLLEKINEDVMIFPGHGKPDKFVNLKRYLVKFGSELKE